MPSSEPPGVVLDTNVLIGAAYNPDSASRRLLDACMRGELIACLSPAVAAEYEFIIDRAIGRRRDSEFLRDWLAAARVVHPRETPAVVADDPEDDKLVAVALTAKAVLISSDHHLLDVNGIAGLEVLTPGEAASRLLD